MKMSRKTLISNETTVMARGNLKIVLSKYFSSFDKIFESPWHSGQKGGNKSKK
jgi:hypothetical protein